jgi:transitional endoplasmic reticulum ATPase
MMQLCAIYPFTRRDVYEEWGIHPPKGILIHGPTGVGKTALCLSIVNEIRGVHCVIIAVGELMSKVVGDSEKKIAQIFRDARQSAPSLLIFDSV